MSRLLVTLPLILLVALLPSRGVPTMLAADTPPATLTRADASAFAKLALKGASREYPNKPGHVLLNDADAKTPRALHPAFFGNYDWHSSVHGHWMLARILKTFPDLPEAKAIRAVLNDHLTAKNIEAEVAYFNRPEAKSFERPYGWTWLLKLAEELHGWDDPDAKKWSRGREAAGGVDREALRRVLPEADLSHPFGRHSNTAFGLTFAHDYARAVGDTKLREVIEERAKNYYGEGCGCARALGTGWGGLPLPELVRGRSHVARVAARGVPRLVPQVPARRGQGRTEDALRARHCHRPHRPATRSPRWPEPEPCLVLRGIAAALPADDPARKVLVASAKRHAEAGLKHIASGDYAGEHWLASFAIHMLATPAPE